MMCLGSDTIDRRECPCDDVYADHLSYVQMLSLWHIMLISPSTVCCLCTVAIMEVGRGEGGGGGGGRIHSSATMGVQSCDIYE